MSGWFADDDCDCLCEPPCDYNLTVKVDRCPPVYNVPQVEEYTFTFDGPLGEHEVITDYIDTPTQAGATIVNPSPGTWTVTIEGPAGTCIKTVAVTECQESFVQLHAMHAMALDCRVRPLEGVEWSVSGSGVGIPSSGTTGSDGLYAYLLCANGDFDVTLDPPAGSYFEGTTYTVRKDGLRCPRVIAGQGQLVVPEGYLCGCHSECPWPVKDDLLLTTKYGTFPFYHQAALSGGAGVSIEVFEAEARPPIDCTPGSDNGYGGRYVGESGSGHTVPVIYEISCAGGTGAFRVTKTVRVLPVGEESYSGLEFVGFRMTDSAGTPLTGGPTLPTWSIGAGPAYGSGGTVVTSVYDCHTVSATGSLPSLVLSERRTWTGPCVSASSAFFGVSTYTIPGTDESLSISEAP